MSEIYDQALEPQENKATLTEGAQALRWASRMFAFGAGLMLGNNLAVGEAKPASFIVTAGLSVLAVYFNEGRSYFESQAGMLWAEAGQQG